MARSTPGYLPVVTERDSEGGDQETYGDYCVDDEDQPSNVDGLPDPDVDDELDRGYSPPENWSAGQGFGNTPYEEATGESLDQRVAQEETEPDPYVEAERADDDEDLDDGEVGDQRAGRLVDPDQGSARTPSPTWSATTSASTVPPPPPRRPPCTSSPTGTTSKGEGAQMAFILWILAVILVVSGIVQLFRGAILWGVVLIVVGLLVGPGGVSIFT